MKKTLLAIGLLASLCVSAQNTVTFEDLTLAPHTHYDGSDSSGGFTSYGVNFENDYDFTFDYWAYGWIYSNTTDVTTAGYTNDFSAYAGHGAAGSANYAVNYGGVGIDFGTERNVQSIDLTNNTYAALSMKNGDTYGKKFGSIYAADGTTVDGTNGEDYFRLVIVGSDYMGMPTDSVTFYLADYRAAGTAQDYIVKEWSTVLLRDLGAIRYLDFKFQSSDVGSFGVNTPTYFAMDNLKFEALGVSEKSVAAFKLYPNPANGSVAVKGDAGTLNIYNAAGALVWNGQTTGLTTISLENWNAGFYMVELINGTGVSRSTLVKN